MAERTADVMRLRLSVDDEVMEVTAPVGTTIAELAAALPPASNAADAGLFLDGAPLPPDGVVGVAPVLHGVSLSRGPGPPRAQRPPRRAERIATSATGTGYLLVHPGPRVDSPAVDVVVDLPASPAGPAPTRFPWVVAVVPAVMAVPVAVVLRQPLFLLLGVLAPVAAVLQHRLERRHHHRTARRRQVLHREAVASAQGRIGTALAEDHARRHAALPPPARVGLTAAGPGPRLWERRPGDRDTWILRLGRGDVPAAVSWREPGCPPHRLVLPDAPVTVDLCGTPVLGLAGPRDLVLGLARALVVQLAVWHSPHDLHLQVPDAPAWWWVRWLPHARTGGSVPGGRTVTTVTVLDGPDAWRHRPDPPAPTRPGVPVDPVICVAPAVLDLPAACSAVVAVEPSTTAVLTVRGGVQVPFTVETVPQTWAASVARQLAPLVDGAHAGAADTCGPVLLADLLERHAGLDATDPDALIARWRSGDARGGWAVPLGTTGEDVWWVDLVRDGPHALLAGTTGSGKSALLTSWVLGLAALHPPQELTVLLVDFKGGAAFAALQGLPHVCGVLTDLDPGATRRALGCVTAELRTRERLLTAAGAADLDTYLGEPGGTALARLLIVVDEYRVLAEEHPDLLASLVRVATVGRSLGVHLVLATQRPGGVVGADLRANIDLRLALRVADHVDSVDVLGTGQAAQVPAGRPGHGFARRGGELVTFRAALPAARLEKGHAPPVTVHPPRHPEQDDRGTGVPTRSIDPLVGAVTAAGRTMGPLPAPLWLPPLPDEVRSTDLPPLPTAASGSPRGLRLPFALADRPGLQRQDTLAWDLERDGHLAVVGAPGSGRTGALDALAVAAWRAGVVVHRIAPCPARATGPVAAGTGTVVDARDVEHSEALLTVLREPVVRGRRTTAPGPWTLLLIDDWESTVHAWQVDHGRLVEDLLRLLRHGTEAGLRVAVAGGKSVLTGPGPLLTRRLLLRPADALDLSLAGVSPRDVPALMPPGRAVVVGAGQEPVEVQVVLAAGDGSGPVVQAGGPGQCETLPLEPLPAILHPTDRRLAVHPPGELVLGLVRDPRAAGGLAPGGWPTVGTPAALVVGPAGSGRSTTLATTVASLRSAGRRVVTVGHGDGGGPGRPAGSLHFDTDDVLSDPAPLMRALEEAVATAVLVVDDVAGLGASPAGEAVLAALTAAGPGHRRLRLVAAAAPNEVLTAFRGLVPWARSARTGLLLGPHTPADAEVFGVRVPVGGGSGPPGRALLVRRGRAVPLQVAVPPDERGAGGAVPADRGG